MTTLSDQLKNIKLRKVTEPIKDFSSPKTAGYISQQEITDYQNCVLDVNAEKWIEPLKELTFPTRLCPLTLDDARLFVKIYESTYRDVESEEVCSIDWRSELSPDDEQTINDMLQRLDAVMAEFTKDDGYAFVKTSCRSAKDAPLVQKRFKDLYQTYVSKLPEHLQTNENEQITCLLKAAFEGMKVARADDAVDMFMRSERIYQDMLLATELKDRFQEHFVVRKFVHMDVDMEFRGFVFGEELVALSQYNYAIFSQKLFDMKDRIQQLVLQYFHDEVKPRLDGVDFPKAYIIDFAVCDDGQKVWVIEINPFAETTDGGLFSWQHERRILEGEEGFQFRIVERPKPGAKAILPRGIKALLK